MNELIFNGCHKPLQFTTRKPRDDKELDDYVFLTKEQFIRKLDNGDFIEHIVYNGEYYAITKYFDTSKSNVFVADPA
jgi:guanylate kinase